ncbi:MAG: hypothetical protein AB4911_13980 [Oscillochloridaceae bacterium umkhey_bin13]
MQRVEQRWQRALLISLGLYTLALPLTIMLLRADLPTLLRYLIAIIPVLPIGYGILAYTRFLAGLDELQQRIQLYGLAMSVGGTGLITISWGFLELAGLPRLSTLWVFPILIWLWGLGVMLVNRRYQ